MAISTGCLAFNVGSKDQVKAGTAFAFILVYILLIVIVRPFIWKVLVKLFYEPDGRVEDFNTNK